MAVLIRMCDEDRQRFPGGPEWLRFDEADLDDLDGVILADYETSMNVWFHNLYNFDKPRNTIRWQMCQVWMACRLAGMDVPALVEFTIKIRKVERKEEPAAGDAVPPAQASSSTSSAAAPSGRRKR
jgi:hypothetical protein